MALHNTGMRSWSERGGRVFSCPFSSPLNTTRARAKPLWSANIIIFTKRIPLPRRRVTRGVQREEKTNKSGQSIPLRNRIFAGASRAHDVAPWTLREKGGGDFQLHLCLSGAVFFSFFFFFFLFASQLFSPSQLLASSAVNLAVYNLQVEGLFPKWDLQNSILTVINLRIALMCLLPVFWRPFIHNLMLLRPCISQP